MRSRRRGLGLMIWGVIFMFLSIWPMVNGNNFAIIAHVCGWVMFIAGLIFASRQKQKNRNFEKALYRWAETGSPVPQPRARRGSRELQQDWAGCYVPPPQARTVPDGRHYGFRIAGINYRIDAISALAVRNADFFVDPYNCDGAEGFRYYEFLPQMPDPVLFPQPNNPYDRNAIAVYAGGWMIGYVPAAETSAVRPIISGPYSATARLSGGRWRSAVDGQIVTGESKINVTVDLYY